MSVEEKKDQLSLNLKANSISKTDESKTEPEGDTIEWICHPAKRKMYVTVLVTVFLISLVFVVYFVTYSALLTSLSVLFLWGSLSSFYFPTQYKLSENEIIVKTTMQTLKKEWSIYRTYYPDKNGVLLSPFARRTRMENFRGLYVKFESNKDEVMAFVEKQMTAQKLKIEDEG